MTLADYIFKLEKKSTTRVWRNLGKRENNITNWVYFQVGKQ